MHSQLKGLLRMMFTERERLKNSLERDSGANASQQQTVAVLRQALSDVSFSQGLELEKTLFGSVQFKVLSMCLEKPICAPPPLSEVSPVLPLKTLTGEDFSGERQLGGCLAALTVLKLALGNVSCQGLVLLENSERWRLFWERCLHGLVPCCCLSAEAGTG